MSKLNANANQMIPAVFVTARVFHHPIACLKGDAAEKRLLKEDADEEGVSSGDGAQPGLAYQAH